MTIQADLLAAAQAAAARLDAQAAIIDVQTAELRRLNLKPVTTGLITRDAPLSDDAYRDSFQAYSAGIDWQALNPAAAQYNPDPLDHELARARALGYKQMRLRIYGHPKWLIDTVGGVQLHDPLGGNITVTAARWWLPAHGIAYASLHKWLASRYDFDPILREVSAHRTCSVFAEPFIRQLSDAQSQTNLKAAGYTTAADQQAMQEMIDAHDVWVETRTGIAHNPYQDVDRHTADLAFTIAMMDYERHVLGERAVLENNSLDTATEFPVTGLPSKMYQAIKDRDGAIAFQTQAMNRLSDVEGMLNFAVSLGAQAVEFPAGGWTTRLSHDVALKYAAMLTANA